MLQWISDRVEKVVRVVQKWSKSRHHLDIDHVDDPVSKFLHQKFTLFVISSNVKAAMYDPDTQWLHIAYNNGDQWRYGQVSQVEVERFALAGSKGDWIWENVRIKGKGNKHLHRRPAEPYHWIAPAALNIRPKVHSHA